MIALAVILIAVVVILCVRCLKLRRQRQGYGTMMHIVRDHVVEGDLENAIQICEVSATPGAR